MNIDKTLLKYNSISNDIVKYWIIKYFNLSSEDIKEGIDFEWVTDVGGILFFADYYIGFNDVLDCLNKKIAVDDYHNWYDYILTEPYINISLAKFILSPEEKAKKEAEDLQRLKENVDFAKKEFKKALKNYKQ